MSASTRSWHLLAAVATASVASAGELLAATGTLNSEGLGLTHKNINPRVVATEYAVRGRLLERAKELEAAGRSICRCNIGNPQALGAKPLRWIRATLALCVNRELLELAESGALPADAFPSDVIARARKYLDAIGSVGAYSDSQGVGLVREEVASFLRERDGVDCDASDVFLTDGASAGVRTLMQCMLGEAGVDAILAPSPVYPLYSALSTLMDGGDALYPLHESYDTGVWTIKVSDLEHSLSEARARGVHPRALVIINPGNPTGQCMSEKEVADVLAFAAREGLVLMADEVYQDNVYNQPGTTRLAHVSHEFISFRSALAALRLSSPELAGRVQLVTMHSTSKGYMGECGLRGGFFALDGAWDPVVKSMLVKVRVCGLPRWCMRPASACGGAPRPPPSLHTTTTTGPRLTAFSRLPSLAARIHLPMLECRRPADHGPRRQPSQAGHALLRRMEGGARRRARVAPPARRPAGQCARRARGSNVRPCRGRPVPIPSDRAAHQGDCRRARRGRAAR